jgi:hypothetical protein
LINPIKKVTLENRGKEAHMMGDCVAVCWNVVPKTKVITKDGIDYKAEVYVRTKVSPYIDFINLREDENEVWEDDDSPVDEGLSLEMAEKIHKELGEAIEYLKQN